MGGFPSVSKDTPRFSFWFSALYSLFFVFLYYAPPHLFSRIEEKLQDRLFVWRGMSLPTGDPRIVIVALDDEALQLYGFPPPRKVHAELLGKLQALGAKTVAFDLFFINPRAGSQALIDATRRFGHAVHQFLINWEQSSAGGAGHVVLRRLEMPIKGLVSASQYLGYPNLINGLSADGHPRAALLFYPYLSDPKNPSQPAPAFAAAAAASFSGKSLQDLRRRFDFSTVSALQTLRINFRRWTVWPYHPGRKATTLAGLLTTVRSPYRTISYVDVMTGRLSADQRQALRGALVFLGSTSVGYYDHYPSPFSDLTPGVVYNANVADNILHDDFLRPISPRGVVAAAAVSCGAGLIMIWLSSFLMLLEPLASTLLALSAFAGWSAFAWYAFTRGWRVDFVAPLFALASSFFVQISYRVFAESREKKYITDLFGQFVSPAVVSELAKDPAKVRLGGEKREMTILFLDIAHFTAISEKMDPEALLSFLNRYLSAFSQAIMDRRGAVDKYIGDCVMAFWNAPLSLNEHQKNACLAAIECQEALLRLNEDQDRSLPEPPSIRIGLSSGVVTVGLTGSQRKLQYTTIGDEVNLASRLEGANKYFGTRILASESTFLPAASAVAGRKIGRVRVVGKETPVAVYELLAKTDSLADSWRKALPVYDGALSLFGEGRYEKAASVFEEVLRLIPGDGPSQLYIKACRDNIQTPPLSADVGVFNLIAK